MAVTRQHLSVTGGDLPIVATDPSSETPQPALVIVPSIFGVTDDLIEQMEELSGAGWVVALDPFWRVKPGPLPYTDFQAAVDRMKKLDRETSFADFVALVTWVRSQPQCNGKTVGVGICFGAPFCLLAAADGLLDGVVTWHGSRMPDFLNRSAEMTVPMRHHIGGSDSHVPTESVNAIKAAFAGRNDVEIVVHDGADHGFTQRNSPAWDESAEQDALRSTADLLRELA